MRAHKMRGFSLLEIMAAISIMLISSAIILMGIQPALKQTRVNAAYNTTLNVLRQARDTTISQRQTYFVTLNNAVNPNTITVTQASSGLVVSSYTLPTDVKYQVMVGFPAAAPDGFGAGAVPIDFDQGIAGGANNVIYFYPDGSAQDVAGNVNNGIVYIARAGDFYSARAITVWGATGRIRGWQLDTNAGVKYWRQQ